MNSAKTDTTVVLKGAVIRSDSMESAVDMAASIYLIQNQDRPDDEWDTLPEELTAEDIQRAQVRFEDKRRLRMAATQAYAHDLCTLIPRENTCAIDGCGNRCSGVICWDCEAEIGAERKPAGRTSFLVAVTLFVVLFGVIVWAVTR